MIRILVIEDEQSIADTLLYALKSDGFDPAHAATLEDARKKIPGLSPQFIILDVGLPDGNGFEFCKEIRSQHSMPILFLTARNDEIDRIIGLEIGADDYVTKPFSPREVVARVKNILRRTQTKSNGPTAAVARSATSEFTVNEEKRKIHYRGKLLELSRYEYGLLLAFIEQPGRVFTREQLMEKVWTDPQMSTDRTVDTHVKSLRAKLREIAPDEDPIQTHRGLGYSLKESE